jgi:hypothetical protein
MTALPSAVEEQELLVKEQTAQLLPTQVMVPAVAAVVPVVPAVTPFSHTLAVRAATELSARLPEHLLITVVAVVAELTRTTTSTVA